MERKERFEETSDETICKVMNGSNEVEEAKVADLVVSKEVGIGGALMKTLARE